MHVESISTSCTRQANASTCTHLALVHVALLCSSYLASSFLVSTVMLDLSELIAFEKQCCRDGCSRDGAISCSQCKVAVWCSPECLQENFNKHQLACRLGEEQLNELNL